MNYLDNWDEKYGEIFSKRAKGILPEMESSKSIRKIIKKIMREYYSILDVGCGVGHYFPPLKKLKLNFYYYGVDVTKKYIEEAKKIFQKEKNVYFKQGNIFKLPYKSKMFNIVLFVNTLENLPSIEKPIFELLRVSKKYVIIRTLVDDRSFYIKESKNDKFFKSGEPKEYGFFNIYSRKYLTETIRKFDSNCRIKFIKDKDYKVSAIQKSSKTDGKKSSNITKIMSGMQVNGPILMNWEFIIIEKN